MIRVANLAKCFEDKSGRVMAVDDVSFDVAEGELFTLLGPSGCGKTTTLRCIAGLERPSKGEIYIHDRLVFSSSKNTFAPPYKREIGMVFQSYAIWPHMTVLQNVMYPLRSRGHSREEAKRLALEALDKVGLLGFSDRPAPKLSGGQQQRVALARAIAGSPKSLLLDEPLSNLDAKLREEMRGEIRKLQRRLGITALYVTHDQTEALSMSDQIAIMKNGKIVEIGSPQDIYLRPKSDFAANFIGLMNVIPGKRMDTVSRNGIVLQVPFGELHCPLNENAAAGQELVVMVRPENVKVLPTAPFEKKNIWPGRLIDRTFIGESIDCRIAVEGFTLRARIDPHGELKEGHQVFVHIDPSRCVTLATSCS